MANTGKADSDRAPQGSDVRALLRACDRASLATTLADGAPYASLVLLALDLDATPLLLLSDLAEHSRNLARDPRLSLLIDGTSGLDDPLAGARASLAGRAEPVSDARLLARFTSRHPSSEMYAGFGDFRLYCVRVERAHLVAGFGRIRWIDASEILLAGDARALAAAEASILEHMNSDHADAVNRIARRASGAGGDWRMTGIDPEGADFRSGGRIVRQIFRTQIWDAGAARSELVHLAREGGATPAGGA